MDRSLDSAAATEAPLVTEKDTSALAPHNPNIWLSAIAGFFFLATLVFTIHQIDFGLASSYGLTVSDSVGITYTLEKYWSQGKLLNHDPGLPVISVLYGWTWFIHPALCFVVNVGLMVLNVHLFKRVVIRGMGAPAWSVLGLLANPYLILVMPGPNKEIPLLLLTLLLADVLFRANRRWWLAVAICIPMYFLRDGYGLFMLMMIFLLRVLGQREHLLPTTFLIMMVTAATLWSPLSTLIPVMSRNLSVYTALSKHQEAVGSFAASLALDPLSPIGGLVLYGLRLTYNLMSLAIFPVLFTKDGNFYWSGLAYWFYGLMCLMAWLGCALGWYLLRETQSRYQHLAASLALCTWFMISLSLFVQPRYLMPMLPLAFGTLATSPSKVRLLCISFSMGFVLLVMSAYVLMGRHPAPATPDKVDPPAYVWRA